MQNPLLSICIPTYNRSGYLRNCLESIKIQLQNQPLLNEMVEVVVSDNASADDTKQVSESYAGSFSKFKYLRNDSNVGFDLNVYNAVKNATGEFCWYLGDDDLITNGGIAFVIDLLKDRKYEVLTVESKPVDGTDDFLKMVEYSKENTEEVKDFNEFYFKGYCQGGLSVLLFSRALWLQLVDTKDLLYGWLYYETVVRMLAVTKKPMMYVRQPVIRTGQDCRWAENGNELFTFTNSNILMKRMMKFQFDQVRLKDEYDLNRRKIVLMLLRAKGHGLKCSLKNLKYIWVNYIDMGYIRFVVLALIFLVPNQVIVWLRDLRKNIKQ